MARPTKYKNDLVTGILKDLEARRGRVRACRNAGIHYNTFLDWFENKPEFSEAVKKAEAVALEDGRDTAVNAIFQAMENGTWQAAAWFLERNFERYKLKTDNTITHGGSIKIPKIVWGEEKEDDE